MKTKWLVLLCLALISLSVTFLASCGEEEIPQVERPVHKDEETTDDTEQPDLDVDTDDTEEDATENEEDEPTVDTDDEELTKQFVVTLVDGSETTTKTVTFGDAYFFQSPYKTGNEFLGWYDGDTLIESSGVWNIESDMTLHAKWEAYTYKVFYDADGGVIDRLSDEFTYGDPYEFPEVTREGYTFLGWRDYNGKELASSGTWEYARDEVYLSARWQVNTYTITFDANGGEIDTTSKTVEYDSYYSLPTLSREGYEFLGWFIGDSVVNSSEKWTFTSDIELVAKWRANVYKVKLETNGGSIDCDVEFSITYGEPYKLSVPVRPGYVFVGWYYDDTEFSISGAWTLAKSVDLEARWILDSSLADFIYTATPSGIVIHGTVDSTKSSYTIPLGVVGITESAFSGCKNLKSIKIPNSVTSIGRYAFSDCESLSTIELGSSVEKIGSYAFSGCESLTSITVDRGNPNFYSSQNCLLEAKSNTLILGTQGCVIPSEVTGIGVYAFVGCTEIVIPDSVTEINYYAFLQCPSLESIFLCAGTQEFLSFVVPGDCTVYFYSEFEPETEGNYWHYDNGAPTKWPAVSVTPEPAPEPDPEPVEIGFVYAFDEETETYTVTDYTGNDSTLVIPSEYNGYPVTKIGRCAFEDCISLICVTIPDSIEIIGSSAFSGCSALETVLVGSGVKNFGEEVYNLLFSDTVLSAFGNCDNLRSITISENNKKYRSENNCIIDVASKSVVFVGVDGVIPSDGRVTSIGSYAFYGDRHMRSVIIPASVTSVHYTAFYTCPDLESITVAEGNSKYYSSGNCLIETETKTVVIGCNNSVIPTNENIQAIGNGAFWGKDGLSAIVIPDTVTTIGFYSFRDCSGLTELVLSDNVTSIGRRAFASCKGLRSVIIGKGLKSIGIECFEYCNALETVTIYGNIAVSNKAFQGCKSLRDVYIEQCKSISTEAFYNCSALRSLSIKDCRYIGSNAFMNCVSLYSITIPSGVENIEWQAFSGCNSLTEVIIEAAYVEISDQAFSNCESLRVVYYKSTEQTWNGRQIGEGNDCLINADRYYYSNTKPKARGNYWHYIDGKPSLWF